MAAQDGPDTMAGRAALEKAERARDALGAYVADNETFAEVIAASTARLRRRR